MSKARLAILDMYEGTPNQGMRCIKEIVEAFRGEMTYEIFDVRRLGQVPDLSFDLYISTGGPGNPLEGNGVWEVRYFDWLQQVWDWNQYGDRKKHVFFICHSFQMAVHHFGLAKVNKRRSMSFGTFPVHLTDAAVDDPLFQDLGNPFWAADFRHYQVVQPDLDAIDEMGAEIIALEKVRPHVPLERAVMGIRFSPEMVGVQFHPEADPQGMIAHFVEPERRIAIMEEHGPDKYHQMLVDLRHPKRIARTHLAILPTFLQRALAAVAAEEGVMA